MISDLLDRTRTLVATIGLVGILLTPCVMASDIPLELTTALEPSRTVVPGERVRVLISVATPRWFTGGTRLRLPEIPGLLLLQNQEFASNATERRGEETWTLQRWSVDAFATRAGNFTLQPIEVTASVSVAPGSEKTLTLYTKPQSFSVTIPQALAELDGPWIASPKVTIEQRVDGANTVALGAAVKRTIAINADGVMAMMLPSFTQFDNANDIPNLQRYPEPPLLSNKATRGALNAKRVETTTYIATAPGDVRIPPSQLYWWNTTDASLQVLSTPDVQFTISGTVVARAEEKSGNAVIWLGWLLLALLSAVSAYWLWQNALTRAAGQILRRLHAWFKNNLQSLTANPLPDRLNPGGSPAEPWAAQQPQRD